MARTSIYSGRAAESRGLTIRMLLENIQILKNHISELEEQMEEILSHSSDDDADSFPGANLLTVSGVGKKTIERLCFLLLGLKEELLTPGSNILLLIK